MGRSCCRSMFHAVLLTSSHVVRPAAELFLHIQNILLRVFVCAAQRQDMVEGVRATASAAASQGQIEWGTARSTLKAYEGLLDSYTYVSL